jgi:hypothetical protein
MRHVRAFTDATDNFLTFTVAAAFVWTDVVNVEDEDVVETAFVHLTAPETVDAPAEEGDGEVASACQVAFTKKKKEMKKNC